MKSREKKHARGEGPGASAHTWPHPLLPHSPTASECPGPLPASSFLPPPWDGRCPPRPEGGAWWWLSLPSAGSTTACPSDPSTKCVPVLRVHPVGLGDGPWEGERGFPPRAGTPHFHLAGATQRSHDLKGCSALSPAGGEPRPAPLPLSGARAWREDQGAHPTKFSASARSHHPPISMHRRTSPRGCADCLKSSRKSRATTG